MFLHKLKSVSADSTTHCGIRLQKGDRVIRCANGQRGVFLGFVNVSKSTKLKCAVLWDSDVSRAMASNNNRSGYEQGFANAAKKIEPCKQNCAHDPPETIDAPFCQEVESANVAKSFRPYFHSCGLDTDGKSQKYLAPEAVKNKCTKCPINAAPEAADRDSCQKLASANVDKIFRPHCHSCDVDADGDLQEQKSNCRSRDKRDKILVPEIEIGDLIYDRCHDDSSARPKWMVVTQSAHRGAGCNAKNAHHLPDEGTEPLRITLAPALFGKLGVTNKPDPSKQPECWEVKLVKDAKTVTNIFINGYEVMCRDNYHVCLLSCRKFKGTLRARYCRMRLPRRPMEYTCFSQLYIPNDTVCNFVSLTPNREKLFVARPRKEIQQNVGGEDYWNVENNDVLASPDERALVLDLARLSGTRAMNSMPELMREQLVPTLMSRLLRRLPATEILTTVDVHFQKRPFGFVIGAASDNDYTTVSAVESGSLAAKAGVLKGMELIKVQEVCVRGRSLEEVQKSIKQLPDRDVKMTFRNPRLPTIQEPGVYNVKHRSAIIAGLVVSHIESFLGYTHTYNDDRMAETSPILASLLNCNTNVQLIGSVTSAMAILQYLSGYLSKNPVELCNFLSCIIAARRQYKLYKSTAEDAGTQNRNAKFMAQKVIIIAVK